MRKRDSNSGVFKWNLWNFQKQWWLPLKTCNIYCVGNKLAIFNAILLLYCIYCEPNDETWDLRHGDDDEHDVASLWEERADSRNVCLKQKEVLLMLYYINENWSHFIKEYLEWFSKFAFQEVAHPVGRPNRHFGNFTCPQTHFGC